MSFRILLFVMLLSVSALAQVPPTEPGVSQELARWRAVRYSNVRYKLNLTLEKMSPVLKGSMEIRLSYAAEACSECPPRFIVLDWRKIRGHEEKSTISKVSINGKAVQSASFSSFNGGQETSLGNGERDKSRTLNYFEQNEHLIFSEGVVMGENVITLDFTSPILTSGSAITRYVDKEDGSEYLYSLFVPSDASTAFPVFDQPDLKARFMVDLQAPAEWKLVSNAFAENKLSLPPKGSKEWEQRLATTHFSETKPISTYVFAFAAGPFERVADRASRSVPPAVAGGLTRPIDNPSGGKPFLTEGGGGDAVNVGVFSNSIQPPATAGGTDIDSRDAVDAQGGNLSGSEGVSSSQNKNTLPTGRVSASDVSTSIYVRRSQAAKFQPHANEVFRLNREAVKYFEEYFDYKFPFPKYDLVLIPEFPFGGMEHAGATFLRESSIIFPQEPTRNDHISRATLIFHEAAHQWFGDTVTMRWFDDLWLKEGFATFTAYKAMERIMPEMNAWKVFYERVKQAAYQTDATKGTTPIYQEIKNLSAAKSAYGAIVYNKAPAFLRQAEFYLGEDKFQTAVRAFLKKHEFGNAGWEDLVKELVEKGWTEDSLTARNDSQEGRKRAEEIGKDTIRRRLQLWVTNRGVALVRTGIDEEGLEYGLFQNDPLESKQQLSLWIHYFNVYLRYQNGKSHVKRQFLDFEGEQIEFSQLPSKAKPAFIFPNYGDYGYGIFLLDEKSRDYVLKNIQNEKDPFLRSMMWGALWDSVREGELDPREYVELVVDVQSSNFSLSFATKNLRASPEQAKACTLNCEDESTTALLLNRIGTAMNYYIDSPPASAPVVVPPRSVKGKQAITFNGGVSLQELLEGLLIDRMRNAGTLGQRITYYRALLNVASSEKARGVLKELLRSGDSGGNASVKRPSDALKSTTGKLDTLPNGRVSASIPLKTKDRFDIVTRLLILDDPDATKLLADLEKTETSDDSKRYAYAAKAGIGTAENKAKYWNDFVNNKEISESWIEAAFGPWNSIRHSELTLPYLERALKELPNHKRSRKIFFVNGWLAAFIGGQRSEAALAVVNKFLADNPGLDNDLRLKILENVDVIDRAVRIRKKS